MAVLKPRGKPELRMPSLKGAYMVDTYRGKLRVRAWPKPRGPAKTLEEQQRRDWFRSANRAAKYVNATEQQFVNEAVKSTSLLPRDLHIMLMAGRAWFVVDNGGGRIYPMAAVQDVSDSLDVLGAIKGNVLFRGDATWEALAPGSSLQVLTIDSVTGEPIWMDAASTAQSLMYTNLLQNGASATSFATKGWWFDALTDIKIHHVITLAQETNTARYKLKIARLTGSTIAAIVAEATEVTATVTGVRNRFWTPTSTPTLTAGSRYAILHVRSDSLGTTPSGMRNWIFQLAPVPFQNPAGSCWGAFADPVATNVLTVNTDNALTTVSPYYSLA